MGPVSRDIGRSNCSFADAAFMATAKSAGESPNVRGVNKMFSDGLSAMRRGTSYKNDSPLSASITAGDTSRVLLAGTEASYFGMIFSDAVSKLSLTGSGDISGDSVLSRGSVGGNAGKLLSKVMLDWCD